MGFHQAGICRFPFFVETYYQGKVR